MTTTTASVRTLPFLSRLTKHWRVPVNALEEAGAQADGELVRLGMGPFRPYLVTHPDHVQHVLTTNQPNFVREGMFWDPLAPLVGHGILSDGDNWAESRRILQPLFTARYVNSLAERMAESIDRSIDEIIVPGPPLDIAKTMSAIVHPMIVRLFFGEKISVADMNRLGPAYDVAVTANAIRHLLPFVPDRVPLPGDRAFRRAIRTVDEVIYRRIEQVRTREQDGDDVVSRLCQARRDDAGPDGDRRIRDDMVAMHGPSTDTTTTVLTWVWPALHAHPEAAARVYEEVERVVGDAPVSVSHLPDLTYLRMFVSEVLRLYPPAWMLPRKALATDVVGGVTIEAGSTVILSPYLTQRLPRFWDRPLTFDPERFAPGNETGRHRYAYLPFIAGPHVCLGQALFMMEAPLLIAGILRRFRPVVHSDGPVSPQLASSLRPPAGLTMALYPIRRS